MKTRLAWIAGVLLSLSALDAIAQSSITPVADAYVQDGSGAEKNFGTAKTLQMSTGAKAGSNADSYLSFDLSGVPPFAQAKLRLYASGDAQCCGYGCGQRRQHREGGLLPGCNADRQRQRSALPHHLE